jgi:hypothetical protein
MRPRAGPGGTLWLYTRPACAASAQHAELNAAMQPAAYEQLQAYCYEQRGQLPATMHVLVSTTSTRQALHVTLHEPLFLTVQPPGLAPTSARAQRRSVHFGTHRVLPVVVSGITPIRDRVGHYTHRAVLHVRT